MIKDKLVCIAGLLLLLFTLSCKKYEEGGTIRKAESHLDGGRSEDYLKQWKVSSYTVNGIDSTVYFKTGSSTDRFSYYDVQISKISKKTFKLATELIELNMALSNSDKDLVITPTSQTEAINCYRANICERNIFMPFQGSSFTWNIVELTEDKLKIKLSGDNQYEITLTFADEGD